MSYTDICLQTGADSGAILPANGHGDREYGKADEVAHGTGEVGVDVALEDVSGEEEGARHAAREQCKPLLMLESGRRCMHRRPQLLNARWPGWCLPYHVGKTAIKNSTVLCTRWSRASALRDNSCDSHLSQAL